MLRQTSKEMAKEICHENISSVVTQRTEYIRRARSRQKIACRDRTWEEYNKSVETKKVDVATRFVSWMSTPRRTYRDIKGQVTTLETGRKQKFYRDKKLKSNTKRILGQISLCYDIIGRIYVTTESSSVATMIIATWKSLLRQKEYEEERPLSR